jgi:hypothetical protein
LDRAPIDFLSSNHPRSGCSSCSCLPDRGSNQLVDHIGCGGRKDFNAARPVKSAAGYAGRNLTGRVDSVKTYFFFFFFALAFTSFSFFFFFSLAFFFAITTSFL